MTFSAKESSLASQDDEEAHPPADHGFHTTDPMVNNQTKYCVPQGANGRLCTG